MEDQLRVFGSYDESCKNAETIKGHNNTRYTIGGNARFNSRGSSIDWFLTIGSSQLTLFDNDKIDKNIIDSINSTLNINPEIEDPDKLSQLLDKLIQLQGKEFLKTMARILKLTEPIMIELRRMHYIILKLKDIQEGDRSYIKFCPYEPSLRMKNIMVDGLKISKVNASNVNMISSDISRLISEINDIEFDNPNSISNIIEEYPDKKSNENKIEKLKKQFSEFVTLYTDTFPQLEKMEKLYVRISKKLESICDILES